VCKKKPKLGDQEHLNWKHWEKSVKSVQLLSIQN